METLFHELLENGLPMNVDAPTVTGTTWYERLEDKERLSAKVVTDNPIILSTPRRPFSGVDVLQGNFFESAVVKISGMTTAQLDEFDKKAAFVLYYENEDDANRGLLDPELLTRIKQEMYFSHDGLLSVLQNNGPQHFKAWNSQDYDTLFDNMAEHGVLKIAVVIAGQGPVAFGMPEMFTPMQHINANRFLKRLATIISDGRYSGVTYGAAIGHMTPEALEGGGILYLKTGDLLFLDMREYQIQFVDADAFKVGQIRFEFHSVLTTRQSLAEERLQRMRKRQRMVAASNRLVGHTDAANGVVPLAISEEAELDYKTDVLLPTSKAVL
jgi:dihydroxyacid dehydratase/phosphogluconate dehydratase